MLMERVARYYDLSTAYGQAFYDEVTPTASKIITVILRW